jgi:hypothetical protein
MAAASKIAIAVTPPALRSIVLALVASESLVIDIPLLLNCCESPLAYGIKVVWTVNYFIATVAVKRLMLQSEKRLKK